MKGTTRVLWQVMANPRELEAFTDDGGDGTTAKRLTHGHTGAWRGANMSAHLEVIRIFCKQVGQLGCPKKEVSRSV